LDRRLGSRRRLVSDLARSGRWLGRWGGRRRGWLGRVWGATSLGIGTADLGNGNVATLSAFGPSPRSSPASGERCWREYVCARLREREKRRRGATRSRLERWRSV